MHRLEGWEGRLQALLEDAEARPYDLGRHDCFRLACRVVEALVGVDRWPEFAGYTTEREALALLARHGGSFEAAFDWFFAPLGEGRVSWRLARRGDLAAFQDEAGQKHLGVCTGQQLAVLGPDGLKRWPMRAALCAWRVG